MLRALPLLLVCACWSGGVPLEGWARTPDGDGPTIVWDLEATPLPEIPFPNDVATRPDARAATGRRINASLDGTTRLERDLRIELSGVDGFGTFAAMWLRFDEPLDLLPLRDPPAWPPGPETPVLVIDVTRNSPTYGQAAPLDLGGGSYPQTVQDRDAYFNNDPRLYGSNLLYDVYDERGRNPVIGQAGEILPTLGDGDDHCDVFEDLDYDGELDDGEDEDGDGRLDDHEDTDDDGVCDEPNVWGIVTGDDRDWHSYRDLIGFYERETDTLSFRPLAPLRERTTYAVVVTTNLRGADGPVRSPFAYVHHLQQYAALAPLFEGGLLERHGLSADQVAFAWTFTTQSVSGDLVALREGLNGVGTLAHLDATYPDDVTRLVPVSTDGGKHAYVLRPERFVEILRLVFGQLSIGGNDYDTSRVEQLLDTYGAVDYVVAGDIVSPDFLVPGNEKLRIDSAAGTVEHQPATLRFVAMIPKARYGAQPFPVALYCHGYTSMKLEALLFSGVLAKFGIATFAIDAYSHGLPLGPEFESVIASFIDRFDAQGLLPFFDAIRVDRARDLNGDHIVDPGGDFWTNDIFHTRDIVRQTVVDYLQSNKILRGFDGARRWAFDLDGDGQTELAGDFNADGVVDMGGPDVPYFVLGTSMGGILSSIIGTVEPSIVAAAPVSPGGGLLEVGLRTELSNVVRAVFLPLLGPMVITEPFENRPELVNVKWLVNDVFSKRVVPFAPVGELQGDGSVQNGLRGGDRLRVTNLASGEVDEVVVPPSRRARAHIPADKGDRIVVDILAADGTLKKRIDRFEYEVESFQGQTYAGKSPLVAIQEGLGLRRSTPEFRRLIGIAQLVLEPGDPVNYGPRYRDLLDIRPEGPRPTNVLFTITMGDMTVPVSTGVALARSAGIIGYSEDDPRYGKSVNQLLIDHHVIEGIDEVRYFKDDCCRHHCGEVNFDIDDLSDGRHESNLPRLAGLTAAAPCGTDPAPDCRDAVCQTYEPLRATRRDAAGVLAARFPALSPRGQHAIDLPDPRLDFDPSMFTMNQIGLFLSSRGKLLSDHGCLAKNDCSTCAGEPDCPPLPPPTEIPQPP